jgi:lipoprotein-releasing system permease protein
VNLLVSIAWTHVRTRLRQTFVGIFAVATGVGFTIMMAGIMQGSQEDFLRQLVDAMPHVTVSDEYPSAPTQPAERIYAAVQMSNPATANQRAGIKYPNTVVSSIESWLPGAVAPTVKTTAIASNHDSRVGVTLMGIDPSIEFKVSK